ncbi:MAG: SGNH/GDSL hydrolase family protein [Smithella sp.]|jgi:lysophospholipase L1-like esterase|nr:SGNH/GDSL hydrolase family protein [Smithella sp.]
MKHELAAVALLPLLFAQAVRVRSKTPRLPEPRGKRCGTHGSGNPLRLFIVGDSAAAGVGVSTQKEALSGRLVSQLGTDFRVEWKLAAKTGHRASDVRSMLEAQTPEAFDVAVTSIGVNDVTHLTRLSKWTRQMQDIAGLLESRFHTRHMLLTGLPPMHMFPALPQPLRWYLGARARSFNRELKLIAERYESCEFVSIDYPLEPAYMAADGFHPGAPAYVLWAGHAADVIRRRFYQP